jgi:hypothetical protein
MTRDLKGNLLVLAALAMLLTNLGTEFANAATFAELVTPKFVGLLLSHFGSVLLAYLGGQVKPSNDRLAGR